ncbi:MAG: endonuclease [Candidatus Vogelbacteria bacterium CG22_combo_CG10-13_8_21_14_all_37_9]|uniref:Endonuclease n=1 Tax=Candidatus Vogelbacteria bacterium CG22_combo_CG10-13_8_21_14_all_37_9 TaxID=1975046 RepID=A0A2H0BMI3_9BACT|nr:MAG: hypothetical protein BK005_00375 [bacterium CG10_37_50]PIP58198.1 MAG: endonuclease [Candidatus Vogelbacteria bacterium CG22_combo_CG10-13_8_21_14_all_37_9]
MNKIPSKNSTGADNQQERLEIESWITGFTDGEGCFSVCFIKNKTAKSGWQIFPEFVITQGEKSLPALKIFQKYFQSGNIYINKRYDNHTENLYRYCIRSIDELNKKVIPFFQKHHLKTFKNNDFVIFAKIVKMMSEQKHLSPNGAIRIAKLVEKMNRKKASRFLKSSETIR